MEFLHHIHLRFVAFLLFNVLSGMINASPYTTRQLELHKQLDVCSAEFSCVNCTTVRVCVRDWKGHLSKLLDFECNGDRPYCDSNSGTCCSAPQSDTCAPKDTTFNCPNDGYYPNPTDCTKFYFCEKGTAYIRTCTEGYFYNSYSENCQSVTCYEISCLGLFGVKKAYEQDSSYYAYCYNDTVLSFEKCPGKLKLDEDSQICAPKCEFQGEQGDPYDCTKYYKCSYNSSWALQPYHKQCPEGEVYDNLNSHCSLPNSNSNCQVKHTFLEDIKDSDI